MLSITPTKLSDYLICPLKFKFRHLGSNRNRESSPALAFGNSIHQALQTIHNQDLVNQNSSELSGDTEKLLKRFWETNSYTNIDEESEYFIKGCRALKIYCETASKEESATLGTEVYMSFVIDFKGFKMRLGCKADRIALHPDQTLEIIDYKTNKTGQVPFAESLERHLPTFLYYVLTRLTYPQYPNIRVAFLNVLSMNKVSVRYERSLVDENKLALWKTLKIIAAGSYAPRPSEACSWCDFQDECPAACQVIDFQEI